MLHKLDLDVLAGQFTKENASHGHDKLKKYSVSSFSNHPYSLYKVEANDSSVSVETIFAERDYWLKQLSIRGGILFRGFNLGNIAAVEQFANHFMTSVFRENTEHTPLVGSTFVQQPVGYASNSFLLWHNENTFNQRWPTKAIFACHTAAKVGGETPVADSREIYQQLDKQVREEFERKGVRYCRRYQAENGIGLGWKTIFNTSSKRVIESICLREGMQYRWSSDDSLITLADRPAVYQVRETGDMCWINQAQHWHFSCLAPELQHTLQKLCSHADEYPRNCYFADGSPIPDSYMAHILDVYRQHQFAFQWQAGDLLLLDNRLKAHARNPYQGERQLLVCFGDMASFAPE
ncbi:MAG TPA: taurine catabolism dioxygenase TauD [Rheinheimera sp.]|uniref:TauD/TfdA family dioxygenase n=1 Tax=Rheinheimera sp. TaxID=1869214 RepID=UPI000EC24AE1|nr:TauD/TfdA family dioxygenase [Rheinheimera sp.]HCU66941.1 taurine catabolism dioxygenase TauD [Rheinheimera sp.]